MTAEITNLHEHKAPEKPGSLPTLPHGLEALIGDGEKSPAQWVGDWYQDDAGNWRFQPRIHTPGYCHDPRDIPGPVREQAGQTLQVLERRMEPASEREIVDGLTEIAIVCGVKASDGQEVWEARYRIYARHLADIPRDILRNAMDSHIESSVFFPKVSELRERAEPMLRERKKHIRRLRELLGMPPPERTMLENLGDSLRMK